MRFLLTATLAVVASGALAGQADCPMTPGTDCRERAEIGPEVRIDSEAMGIVDSEVDKVMVPPTAAEAEDIRRWIPFMCCRSNNCCRKVRADSLAPLGNQEFRVLDTGQDKAYHRWSQDGQVWRCACDWDDMKSKWVVHPGARTRCIFPIPMLGKISEP